MATDISGNTWVLDEDTLSSDSDKQVPTQQSVKAYIDNKKLDDLAAPDDNTDLDFSTSKHGLVPKGTNLGNFLKDDGTWAAAAGGGDVTGPAASTDNALARFNGAGGKTLQDYSSNAPTVSDTGDMNVDGDIDVDNVIVSGNVDGRDVSVDGTKLDGIEAGADVTGSHPPQAHKDSHDPNDGGDPLDCAAAGTISPDDSAAEGSAHTFARSDHTHGITCDTPSEIAGVQAGAEGSAYYFARSDHAHQIQASIADDHILTVDHAEAADNDYCKFTASGIEGRSYTEVKQDLDLEAGTDFPSLTTFNDHSARHESGGDDAIKLDDLSAPDDNTDLDFSTSKHGLVPKGTNVGNFLKDDGTWAAPAGGGDVTGPASSTDNMIARHSGAGGKTLQDYTSNPPTISDTGDMNVDGDVDCDNVIVSGNVDGRDVSTDGAKLDTLTDSGISIDGSGNVDMDGGTITNVGHGIADNQAITVDDADAASGDVAYFTANGLAGYNEAEFKSAYNMEAGTDYLAQQTIGIADNNLLEVDDASAADDDFCRFTASGIEGIPVATAITSLLASSIPENTCVILDSSLSADGKYSGISFGGTAGTNLAFGQVVYNASADSKWELTDADAEATTKPWIAIVCVAGNENAAITLLAKGFIREDDWNWTTPGAPLFIDITTAGNLTETAPSGSGDVVRIAGYVVDANSIYFNPDNTFIEMK